MFDRKLTFSKDGSSAVVAACVVLREVHGFQPLNNMLVNENVLIDTSISEADEEPGMSLHEAEGPGVSKNEYLHDGGWQNVDNPLHELEYVKNEMHSFHLDQEHLEHRQCTICKEAWPTRQNLAAVTYICFRCKRDKKSQKNFSAANDMDPGIVPQQLRGLTQVEEMLISRICPIMQVYRKHGGQWGMY